MKVWPIDPLVPRNLRLEVPEKLPQGLPQRLHNKDTSCPCWNRGSLSGRPVRVVGALRPLRQCIWFWKCLVDNPEVTLSRCREKALKRSARCRPPNGGLRYELFHALADADLLELACGSQAFIATLLFDPSMSALPIIPKQNSVSVGLFTH